MIFFFSLLVNIILAEILVTIANRTTAGMMLTSHCMIVYITRRQICIVSQYRTRRSPDNTCYRGVGWYGIDLSFNKIQ